MHINSFLFVITIHIKKTEEKTKNINYIEDNEHNEKLMT